MHPIRKPCSCLRFTSLARTLRPLGLVPFGLSFWGRKYPGMIWRPRAHRKQNLVYLLLINYLLQCITSFLATGSPTRSQVELDSLTDSQRLKETVKGRLDPLPREKMQTTVAMASEGRQGQTVAPERPNFPPAPSSHICFLLLSPCGWGCCLPRLFQEQSLLAPREDTRGRSQYH